MSMEFFQQLRTFSLRYFETLKITETSTPWGPEEYEGDGPKGATLHYTADEDFDRVVKFFMRRKYNAKASAHVVVADGVYPRTLELMDDLPLVKELPATVVQCELPDLPTWHATWASRFCYGIEAVNVGELRMDGEQQFISHWRRDHKPEEPEWTMPWHHPVKKPVRMWARWWEPFTIDQVTAIIVILRNLHEVYPLDPSWVVGHECVQGVDTIGAKNRDKRDPGPCLPVHAMREAVFEETPTGFPTAWMQAYEADWEKATQETLDTIVVRWAHHLVQLSYKECLAKDPGAKESLIPSADIAWARFRSAIHGLLNGIEKFATVGKCALKLLGYHIDKLNDPDMHDTDKKAVLLFQKMSGLKTDMIPGPKTRKMLVERLYDRGVLK